MLTPSRLWHSRRVRRLLTAPWRGVQAVVKNAPQRLDSLRKLPGRTLDRAAIGWENRRRRRKKPAELVIFDDCFPFSAFRVAEFNAYFDEFPSAELYSTGVLREGKWMNAGFREVVADYEARFPQNAGRTRLFHPDRIVRAKLAYVVFVHNAAFFLKTIERDRLPFVFTLYPGGGFQLNTPAGDARLRKVLQSPWFRKVIVTQRITRDYLVDGRFCRPDQIEFIYGGVHPADRLLENLPPRLKYPKTKPTFDLCFVANKYMPRGIDKGYDVFIDVAKRLAQAAADIRFHVVGPFDAGDIDVSDIADRIRFHGHQPTDFFPEFYSRMDAILSPNVPFTLGPGYFDGFPTGCCVEAALCGTAVFCSDELGMNVALADGKELVIVPRDAETIANRILAYYRDAEALERLSSAGQAAFRRVYDVPSQMAPRIRLLREALLREPV